jgi:hypothetical protein
MTDNGNVKPSVWSDYSLLNTVPAVLRARGFRLYTQDGRRLIDLWLNGGAAILGHTPPNLLRELKNTASRGLYAPLPHFSQSRFIKALSKLFPGRSFRFYAAPPPELTELFTSGAAKLWRPFIDPASPFALAENASLLILVLPGIQSWRGGLPFGLCVTAAESENQLAQLPAGDILPPLLLSVATRGAYDILASPERAKPDFPRLAKVMKTDDYKNRWLRQGIYLSLKEKIENDEWTALFGKFLDAGFLLPPNQNQPLILPGELSDGEEAKLAAVLSGGGKIPANNL